MLYSSEDFISAMRKLHVHIENLIISTSTYIVVPIYGVSSLHCMNAGVNKMFSVLTWNFTGSFKGKSTNSCHLHVFKTLCFLKLWRRLEMILFLVSFKLLMEKRSVEKFSIFFVVLFLFFLQHHKYGFLEHHYLKDQLDFRWKKVTAPKILMPICQLTIDQLS